MTQVEGHIGRTEPQQARSREKYDRVLTVADRMFGKHGVDGTQMTLLARQAKVSVSSLYHLFSDRDEVAEALGGRYADSLLAAQQPIFVHNLAQLEMVISALVDLNYRHHLANPGFTALMLHTMSEDSSPSLRNFRDRQVADFCRELEDLVDVSGDELSRIIGNSLDMGQQFVARVVASGPEDPDHELLHLKWMIMHYVCGRLRPDIPVVWPV